MPDVLPLSSPWWEHLSLVGLLCVCVTALVRGWVVPKVSHDQILSKIDKMHEREQERDAETTAILRKFDERHQETRATLDTIDRRLRDLMRVATILAESSGDEAARRTRRIRLQEDT